MSGYAAVLLTVLGSIMFLVVIPEAERQAHMVANYRDHRPRVEQPFLKRNDSLTKQNFARFIREWRKWSMDQEKEASDTMMNRYYELVLSNYPGSKSDADTLDYVVRRYCVSVFHSEEEYKYSYHTDEYSYYSDLDSYTYADTTYMFPPAVKGKKVLYLTQETDKLLDDYFESRPDRVEMAKRFIPVQSAGMLPGYYSYVTYPDIVAFYQFKNCMIAEVSPNSLIDDLFILPDYSIANYQVILNWIQ